MNKVTISLAALLKAQKKFELFRAHLETEQEKAGAIQAFEFCFELAWRTLKKVLEKQQTEKLIGPRDTIRMGALHRFIGNPAQPMHKASAGGHYIKNSFTGPAGHSSKSVGRFEFLDCRNLTSHTYEEEVADEVIAMFPLFSIELALLVNQLKKSAL